MSRASRLAAADDQIIRVMSLGLNSAGVPGGISTAALDRPIYTGGVEWLPSHAAPWSSSIGYALAAESTAVKVDLTKAGA